MRVGFIYAVATPEWLRERPEMTLRDCDDPATIADITAALEAGGHQVIGYNSTQDLPALLASKPFDIAFNISTGVYGESRQTHIPAMLDYLRIPHTGPGVLPEALCHHKPQEKWVLQGCGVPTPPFQVFRTGDEPLRPGLTFPLICKLPSEGASMGLDYESVVYDEPSLRRKLAFLLETYREGAFAESYIDGREFTVAVLGNDPAYALPVAEVHFFGKLPIRLDEIDPGQLEPLREALGDPTLEVVPMESESRAPAALSPEEMTRVQQTALAAYHALGCQDWARVDMRMDAAGRLYVLEVNSIPGVARDYVLAKCAYAAGWTYEQLVNTILNHAIARYPELNGKTAPPTSQYLGKLVRRADS